MVEVNKPDYLSLVNKGGSGFNVSELVDSIVASEIAPKRHLQETKKETNTNAISGLGLLNSQTSVTEKNFSLISSRKFYSASSSSNSVVLTSTNESLISTDSVEISGVTTAKKMIFELSDFDDLNELFTANLTIETGTWTETNPVIAGVTDTYVAGRSYRVVNEITDANEVSDIRANTSWSGGSATVTAGTIFTVENGANLSSSDIEEVNGYAFTQYAGSDSVQLNFENKNIRQITAMFNDISGLNARLIDTQGDGTDFSLVITSDDTGAKNGFKISGDGRWETSYNLNVDDYSNKFNALATDANFTFNGVEVTREKNTITDIISGANIELLSDNSETITASFVRSETEIKNAVEDIVFSLNEYQEELAALTLIDLEAENNGPLAMDPAVKNLQSKFKRLLMSPITGFGEEPIYLSRLGIKTNNQGNFYLDSTVFEKTLRDNPSHFFALKDDSQSASEAGVEITKSSLAKIDAGEYEVRKIDGVWKLGDTQLDRIDLNGGSRFTASEIPGLVIDTQQVNPGEFKVFFGKNFADKVREFMSESLAANSSLNSAEESYKNLIADIDERLEQLEQREKLITTRYTQQFGQMEQSMTQFNSTKSLLDNFIEAWKKQK